MNLHQYTSHPGWHLAISPPMSVRRLPRAVRQMVRGLRWHRKGRWFAPTPVCWNCGMCVWIAHSHLSPIPPMPQRKALLTAERGKTPRSVFIWMGMSQHYVLLTAVSLVRNCFFLIGLGWMVSVQRILALDRWGVQEYVWKLINQFCQFLGVFYWVGYEKSNLIK